VNTVESLADMTPEQLEAIEGIGPKTVEKISIAVNNYFATLDGGEAVADAEAEPTGDAATEAAVGEAGISEESLTEGSVEADALTAAAEPTAEAPAEEGAELATEEAATEEVATEEAPEDKQS